MRLTENLSSRAKRLTGFLMVLTLLGFAAKPFLPAPSSLASSGKGLINKLIASKKQETSTQKSPVKPSEPVSQDEGHLSEADRLQIKGERYKQDLEFSEQELAKRGFFIPAVPANNMCAGAVAVTDTGTYPILTSLINATGADSTGDPATLSGGGCTTSTGRGVWYTFTPTATASYRFSTMSSRLTAPSTRFAPAPTFNSGYQDSVVAVFTSVAGCTGPFTQIACNDDVGATAAQSEAVAALTASTTYYVLVYKFGSSPGAIVEPFGGIQLYVTRDVPSNDTCSSPQTLMLNQITPGSSSNAADDYRVSGSDPDWANGGSGNNTFGGSISCPGRDVVYQFTPASTGEYTFYVTNGNAVGGVVGNITAYLSTNCPTAGFPATVDIIAGGSRTSDQEVIACVNLTASTTYYLYVDDNSSGVSNGFFAQVVQCSPKEGVAANNDPATAEPIQCGVQGDITPSSDVDVYALPSQASAGARVFAMVNGAFTHLTSPSAEADMRVVTTVDTLECDTDNNDNQFGGSSPNIAGTILPTGTSYLRINAGSTGVAPYQLYSVVRAAATEVNEISDPQATPTNNLFSDASVQTGDFFYGLMSNVNDIDHYKFTANAGDVIFVSLDTNPGRPTFASPNQNYIDSFDGVLDLLDSSGAVLSRVNGISGSNAGSNFSGAGSVTSFTPNYTAEGILFVARTTGTHYVRITANSLPTVPGGLTPVTGFAAQDYLVSVAINCAPLSGGPSTTTVTSINRQSGTDPVCAPASVTYRVTFAAPVSGVTNSNFTLTDVSSNLTGESITSTTAVGVAPTATWDVVVNTGTASAATGNGMLRLDMANSTGVTPMVTGLPFITGQTFTVNATPTADAGPASYGTVCTGASVNLTATVPTVGTGSWSVQSGPNTSSAQFSNTALATSTFTPTAAGSYTLAWTVLNGPCANAVDTATLTVNAGPTASNAGPDQTVCQTTTAVTLAANVPSSGSGTWSVISGPNTSSAQFANTAVANTTFTPVTRPGTYTLQWSIAPSGGGCPASIDTVVITFVASPTTANAGPDQSLCISSAPATLAANTPTFGSGTWSVISGPSTLTSQFANVNSPTTTFTPTGSVAGVYTLQWTIANSPCPSSSDTVVITFTATPTTANAGPDQAVCNDGSVVQLAANTPTVGSGSWTVVSGPDTSTTQFASTTNPTTTFTPAGGAGDYVLQWTITNAPCPASSDTVTISVTSCLELPFLFVADTNNNRIQKYDGTTWTVLGTDVVNGIDGFKNPEAVAAGDGGNLLFVADTGNNRILRSDDGGLTWTAIATTGSTINPAAVKTPAGVAVDAAGNLYISDTGNQRVFRLDGGVAGPAIILAASGTGAGRVSAPQGLAITTANTLFVADSANSRILSIANADVAAANTGTTFASSGSGLAQVRNPQGVGVNAAGDLGVADTGNNRVLLFPGAVPGPATVLTTSGVSLGQTRLPEGITFCLFTTGALAGDTSVIVGDSANNRIEGRILAAGAWQLVTGNPAPPQTATVGSSIGQFRAPSKIR